MTRQIRQERTEKDIQKETQKSDKRHMKKTGQWYRKERTKKDNNNNKAEI
jgi:hypothetical protein